MPVVMRVMAMANGLSIGPSEGAFVEKLDIQIIPDPHWLILTHDLHEAKEWPSTKEAMVSYQEILKNDPVRIDGKPNRPMTAFTVVIEEVLELGEEDIK